MQRIAKYGRAFGLEDYIVSNAESALSAIMQLILEGNAKNLLNGYLKKAAVASCQAGGSNVVVIYLAENSLGNPFTAQTVAALKSKKTPINAEAEAAIVQLKEELLGLVRQERDARLVGDLEKLDALGRAIKVTV